MVSVRGLSVMRMWDKLVTNTYLNRAPIDRASIDRAWAYANCPCIWDVLVLHLLPPSPHLTDPAFTSTVFQDFKGTFLFWEGGGVMTTSNRFALWTLVVVRSKSYLRLFKPISSMSLFKWFEFPLWHAHAGALLRTLRIKHDPLKAGRTYQLVPCLLHVLDALESSRRARERCQNITSLDVTVSEVSVSQCLALQIAGLWNSIKKFFDKEIFYSSVEGTEEIGLLLLQLFFQFHSRVSFFTEGMRDVRAALIKHRLPNFCGQQTRLAVLAVIFNERARMRDPGVLELGRISILQ